MRGDDQQQGAMYSYISPEQRVPQEHPLRGIREIVDAVLKEMSPEFARLYAGNETHASTTDGDARLAKKGKGKEAKLSYAGHVLMENRNGFIVKTRLSKARGTAGCAAALEMAGEVSGGGRVTLGGDKGYDQKELVEALRKKKVTPHVARNEKRRGGSAIDGRTARHAGYEVSQRVWKRFSGG